jgi:hypothetical protein
MQLHELQPVLCDEGLNGAALVGHGSLRMFGVVNPDVPLVLVLE